MVSFNEILNYASNNETVFRDLKLKIENKNIIPYVGSGLSVFAGFPTWGRFLDDLENNYSLKSPTGYNFLERADWIADRIDENLFARYIVDTFNKGNEDFWLDMSARAEKSAALFLLPWLFHNYVVTTNYDLLIEHVYGQVKNYASTNPVSHNNITMQSIINKRSSDDRSPFIFHIHGSVFEPKEIILGQKSYDDAYKSESSLVEALKQIFYTQSLLFLGSSISLNDRPIELLNRMCGSTAKHFAILPCKNGEQTRTYQEMVNKFNITPLLYEDGKHDSVRIILEVLLKEISPSDYDNLDFKLSSNTLIVNDNDIFRHDYSNPVAFVGREKELQELNAFLEADDSVLWWGITGEGGSGKTRLVDQLITQVKFKWSVKCLDIQDEDEINKTINTLSSYKPTLLIVDYVFAYYDRISELLIKLNKDISVIQKVRILLIERNSEIKMVDALCDSLALSNKKRIVRKYQYKEEIYIGPLSYENLKSIMRDYLLRYYSKNEEEHSINKLLLRLKQLDPKLLRPLYAMFISDARGNDKPIDKWGKKEFLEYIVNRESDPIKLALNDLSPLPKNDIALNYIEKAKAYAIFVKGISVEEYFSFIDPKGGIYLSELSKQVGIEMYDLLKRIWLTNNDSILPVQPDIVGEYYLIRYLEKQLVKQRVQSVKDFVGKAWYHPRRASDVMFRLLNDFARDLRDDDVVISDDLYNIFVNIEIPDGIKSISRLAFSNCDFLNSVRLPNSIEDIHAGAFQNCRRLTEVHLPEGLLRISTATFLNCQKLKLEIPSSIQSIGKEAFRQCYSLTDVTIPSSVSLIQREAFRGCESIKELIIPSSLKIIENGVFQECKNLVKVYYEPNTSISEISKSMFRECDNLLLVNLPDSVKSIKSSAFEDCRLLPEIDMSNTLIEEIGMYAFKNCSNLMKIRFSTCLNAIDQYAFSQCKLLQNVAFKGPLELINSFAFENCTSLVTVDASKGIERIGRFTFACCTALNSVELNGTERMGQYAFYKCMSIKTIMIPETVSAIEEGCFENCINLVAINIPEKVNAIHRFCFAECRMLSGIQLPYGVEYINQYAFARSGLKEITVPSSVKKITVAAFGDCKNLKKITIEGENTDVYDKAFVQCKIEKENIIATKYQKKVILKSFKGKYYYTPLMNRSNVGKKYTPPKKERLPRPDIIN